MRTIIRRLWQGLMNRVWYAHPAHTLLVRATPTACLQTLARASRPSTERLHLRNLFTDGRRYFLKPWKDGFQIHSTSRIPWRRGRGRVASVLRCTCSEVTDEITRIDLRAHMTLPFFLDVFLLPGWMSLLLIYGPLAKPLALGASLLLLILSWLWHRYNAVLQATDLIYFVQVALDDLPAATVEELAAQGNPIIHADFQAAWEKFYDAQQHRSGSGE